MHQCDGHAAAQLHPEAARAGQDSPSGTMPPHSLAGHEARSGRVAALCSHVTKHLVKCISTASRGVHGASDQYNQTERTQRMAQGWLTTVRPGAMLTGTGLDSSHGPYHILSRSLVAHSSHMRSGDSQQVKPRVTNGHASRRQMTQLLRKLPLSTVLWIPSSAKNVS